MVGGHDCSWLHLRGVAGFAPPNSRWVSDHGFSQPGRRRAAVLVYTAGRCHCIGARKGACDHKATPLAGAIRSRGTDGSSRRAKRSEGSIPRGSGGLRVHTSGFLVGQSTGASWHRHAGSQ